MVDNEYLVKVSKLAIEHIEFLNAEERSRLLTENIDLRTQLDNLISVIRTIPGYQNFQSYQIWDEGVLNEAKNWIKLNSALPKKRKIQ